jgi:hypothetical protein
MENKDFVISFKLANDIAQYLATKTYAEVELMMHGLRSLKPLDVAPPAPVELPKGE